MKTTLPAREVLHIHPLRCGLGISFLVETGQGLYLIDSGSPGQEKRVLAKMSELGRSDLKLIWITHAHYDHYGSAAALRKLTGAVIGTHQADANSMSRGESPIGSWRSYGFIYPAAQTLLDRIHPLPATLPDFTLEDGQTLVSFGLKATILHAPGHTPGHTCLLLEDGTCFVADLISRFPKPKLQSRLATDWNQLPGSLAHLKAAQPVWIFTGHSPNRIPGKILMQI